MTAQEVMADIEREFDAYKAELPKVQKRYGMTRFG